MSSPRMAPLGAGLFFTMAALLMLEVALTRVFSVIMWYHFAFFAISVALFGLAAGSLAVFLMPRVFRAERAVDRAYLAALGLPLAVPVRVARLAANPAYRFMISFDGHGPSARPAALLGVASLYLAGELPFFVGGPVRAAPCPPLG